MNSNSVPARIVANVFIWVIFAMGSTHIVSTQDYILGYCLSWLMLCKFLKTELVGGPVKLTRN